MTYSIAGICLETGQLGCAVTTSSVCVGARCGQVGPDCVVFSQARTNPSLHKFGLQAHAQTGDPELALNAMKEAAIAPHWRQFGVLDRSGRAVHFTGESCLPSKGGHIGSNCLALGNNLNGDDVLPETVSGFENAKGSLGSRLISALQAGLNAGGENEPLQSAVVRVFTDQDFAYADLRIDKSTTPIADLMLLWEDWAPKADSYMLRALDPDSAEHSNLVEGHGTAE